MTENTTNENRAPGPKTLTVESIVERLESTDELLYYLLNNSESFIELCNRSIHADVTKLENLLSALNNHTNDVKSLL